MKKLNLISLFLNTLVILCGFSAPWGSGTQGIANFDLSKVFVIIALMMIFYWFLFIKHKIRNFPKPYNYFMLFLLLNGIVTYLIIFPELFKFGFVDETMNQDGFIIMAESMGLQVARIFIFVLLGYAISNIMVNSNRLVLFSLSYGFGMTLVALLNWNVFRLYLIYMDIGLLEDF